MFTRSSALAVAISLVAGSVSGAPQVQLEDPFSSGMWDYHQEALLGDPAKIRFDDRVRVIAPDTAEDAFNVPLLVDATALSDVEEIVISVDYGPIPKILSFFPGDAEPKLALRFKIDQATAIRASVRTRTDGWHVGGTLIDAAGGGCTAPALAYASDDWEEKLGEMHGRLWRSSGRARVIVDHPMDTGLADGIPVFIIRDLTFSTDDGHEVARIALSEPVNEDPAFTLYFDPETMPSLLHVRGRDNNGNEIEGILTDEEVN
ncbi:quinoprotein dehydrogenase-associated SoxYZ-like carrier [Ruegeria aquimaris]|uniref:Quinoprotein dehydrogenase-associated SoxYZ-like carrier n=1 Tax=Ruegeria aquimaris TaxID=2984333 RepID=A0ABT3AEY8_9RHOB|nr:quinoprotein dehydrogenase-associated SoxYZ-like carrier [Ruegeria sp. XHP0148]MCV2886867.1 quinoprotein dehydrogenase-associated SoxYZ-like carrier [Ruegeria sp. XHP0148]